MLSEPEGRPTVYFDKKHQVEDTCLNRSGYYCYIYIDNHWTQLLKGVFKNNSVSTFSPFSPSSKYLLLHLYGLN
jgi:hypothetical protein